MERFITIEEDIIYKEDYQMKMLRNNKIIGLIPMRGMGVNDKSQYLYEIGGKISLTGLYERGRVTCDDIESLLSNILLIMHETEEYLLDLSRIYFKPEYIFWGDNRFYFCYYPLKKNVLWEEFRDLCKFLVDHIDYNDENCIEKTHELFERSSEENYDIKTLVHESLISIKAIDERTADADICSIQEDSCSDVAEEEEDVVLITIQDEVADNKKTDNKKKLKNLFGRKNKLKWGNFEDLILDDE